jgi:hypothetical protein
MPFTRKRGHYSPEQPVFAISLDISFGTGIGLKRNE